MACYDETFQYTIPARDVQSISHALIKVALQMGEDDEVMQRAINGGLGFYLTDCELSIILDYLFARIIKDNPRALEDIVEGRGQRWFGSLVSALQIRVMALNDN